MTTLDTLTTLEAQATAAPWGEFCDGGDWWVERADVDGSPAGGFVCFSDTSGDKAPWGSQEDVDLVVAARNALPGLLRVARAAQAMLAPLSSVAGMPLGSEEEIAAFVEAGARESYEAEIELRAALAALETQP